ncbi:MAG: MFS transporter, partial [Firmicutes bacterium]|nr:MFS transporter [Bacillota bacterium]
MSAAYFRRLLPILTAVLVSQTAFGAILPLLPLYVRAHHMPLTWIGWMVAVYGLAAVAGQFMFGSLSDRLGRRAILLWGMLLNILGTAAFLLQVVPVGYIVFRALQGLGVAAVLVGAGAAVADIVPESERGSGYSWFSSASMAGFVLGPLLGGITATVGGLSMPFWIAVILNSLAWIAAWRIRCPVGSPGADKAALHAAPRLRWAQVPWKRIAPFLLVNFGWYGLVGMYDTVWSFFVRSLGGAQWLIGLSFTLFAVPYLLFNWLGGRLANQARYRVKMILGGAWMTGVMVIIYAVSHHLWVVLMVSSLEAVVMSLISPAVMAAVMDLSDESLHGTVSGVFQAFGMLGSVVLALGSGWLLPYSIRAPFWWGDAVLGATLLPATLWLV